VTHDDLATVSITPSADGVHVHVVGEIDMSNVRWLSEQLHAALEDHQTMTVDLTSVEYMDSSGLSLVHQLARFASESSRELRLVASDGSNAHRLLVLTGVDQMITIETSASRLDPVRD
jgi:anti-anti-sigma factor